MKIQVKLIKSVRPGEQGLIRGLTSVMVFMAFLSLMLSEVPRRTVSLHSMAVPLFQGLCRIL